MEFVVSDDPRPRVLAAIREVLPEAAWQRSYVHLLRNDLDYERRKVDDDCLQEQRWFYDRRSSGGAHGSGALAEEVGDQLPEADGLGRGAYRRP